MFIFGVSRKTLAVAVALATCAHNAVAVNVSSTVSGNLDEWIGFNASSKAPTPYLSSKGGIDLFQGTSGGAVISFSDHLLIPVSGNIEYDSNTGAVVSLTLTQNTSVSGWYDTDEGGVVGATTDDVLTLTGLAWSYDSANGFMNQTAGSATGCASSSPVCAFTVSGTNTNDSGNGLGNSPFDFQGINSGFKTLPRSNNTETAYGTFSYKVWPAVPGALGTVDLVTCTLNLAVASRNDSGVLTTNAANTAVFKITNIPNCVPTLDTDGDGTADVQDTDDDNDGVRDLDEQACGTDPLNAASFPADLDSCAVDTDADGVPDYRDAFPNDATESADTDGDTIGDNADTDKDGDGLSNAEEALKGTNPLVVDTDGDSLNDSVDPFPTSASTGVVNQSPTRQPLNVQFNVPGCQKAKRVIGASFNLLPDQYNLSLNDGLEMFGAYQAAGKKYALTPTAGSNALLLADLDAWADKVCGRNVTVSSITFAKNELTVKKDKGTITVKANVTTTVDGKDKKGVYSFKATFNLPNGVP